MATYSRADVAVELKGVDGATQLHAAHRAS